MNACAVFDSKSTSNTASVSGVVEFHSCDRRLPTIIHFKLSGLPPNTTRGVHVHKCGDLTQGCVSACEHYNPFGKSHGSIELYKNDRHVGDLCSNVTSDSDGNVDFIYMDSMIKLEGKISVIGRMIVLHEKADDQGRFRKIDKESGITGNAGKRIACAIIGITDRNLHPAGEEILLAQQNTRDLLGNFL